MADDAHISEAALLDPDRLLEHVGWVRALALRLVHDPHAADDLTQETMLAAIETRGGRARSPRAWLGRVLRNVMWERVRQERRRERREQAVARTGEASSSAELVERVDAHKSVVDAVMRLPEHYRIVLLRRYFEGETPMQIAAALSMPVATVKTRLQRGLERMRQELDAAYGERERWQPALLGLLGVPRRATSASLPMLAAAVLVAALLLGATIFWLRSAAAIGPPEPSGMQRTAAAGPIDAEATATAAAPGREQVASSVATVVDWRDVKMPPQPIRGVVRTPDGGVAAGVLLQFEADRPSSETRDGTPIVLAGDDGAFELQVRRSGMLTAVPGELATVCAGIAEVGSGRETCVVVAPSRPLTGRVVDPHGNGLAHARVELVEPAAMRARLGASAASAAGMRHAETTAAGGAFGFERLPFWAGCRLRVAREGFVTVTVPWHGQAQLEVALAQPPPDPHDVVGVVLTPDGTPAADARVACGTSVTRTDRSGRFRLAAPELPAGADSVQLLAVAPGYGAAAAESTAIDGQMRAVWPAGIELRLSEQPMTLTGRVLFADGRPAPEARVWIADPTLFAHEPGRRHRTTTLRSSRRTDLVEHLWPETVEGVQSGSPMLEPVLTDGDGRFELCGLCARAYRLIACDLSTSLSSEPTTVASGDVDVELRLRSAVHPRIRGHVVDELGNAIAGASVSIETGLLELRWGAATVFAQRHVRGAMRTGPDGSFWLFDVPRERVAVHIEGPGILPITVAPSGAAMTVVATRRSVLSVHCAQPDGIDSVGAVDRQGRAVRVLRQRGDLQLGSERVPMHDGSTEAFEVPADAVELLGYRDGEIRRRATLVPGMRRVDW